MKVFDWNKAAAEPVTELYKRKTVQSQNMSIARLEVKRGASTRLHRHQQEEIIIVLQGTWQFHLPSGDVTLRANQMLTIEPGVEHSSEVLEDVVAIDVCTPRRDDWMSGDDRKLHYDPEQELWAV
jgi:quercetin dioxygenase-like cupin family protein